ncbi:DUF4199 domain-containing protein [Sediminibacterium soli]|uniref:DUF4199 domain-containing protein n=1 Tax=Sediminibacterium soli TaxID=2698829 RepID=UPI00137AE97A|nr:DUF4199 domain-containing protein [Sediminibacterium soli]NCI48015.1 DUF4199 domain-containing protein [Sediminibacterium soli]
MKHPAVRYAVCALVFTVIWTMIQHVAGWNTTHHETGQYTRMVPAIVFYVFIFIAVYRQRKQQGGSLSFGQGFRTGALLSLLYSLGCCLWYALYGEVINKNFKPSLMAFERARLEAAQVTPGQLEEGMKHIDLTTGGSVVSYVFLVAFMFALGCVITLVASLVFKRKQQA